MKAILAVLEFEYCILDNFFIMDIWFIYKLISLYTWILFKKTIVLCTSSYMKCALLSIQYLEIVGMKPWT